MNIPEKILDLKGHALPAGRPGPTGPPGPKGDSMFSFAIEDGHLIMYYAGAEAPYDLYIEDGHLKLRMEG